MKDSQRCQDLKSKAVDWLNNKDTKGGVMLLHEAGASPFAIAIAKIKPEYNLKFIENFLRSKLDLRSDQSDFNGKSFREEFSFLNSSDCPLELEALASRKFARYHTYSALHKALRNCTSLSESAKTCHQLIESYLENRAIWKELKWYQEHHSILGKHPIFAEYARRNNLKTKSVKDLMIRKRQVEMNIWRVQNEIARGDKPYLLAVRKARLEGYEKELEDINRLIG